ncbi:hypothetical protein MSMTP_3046 [Methanosarcina sp. MTP4]|nr:hypothetical protein MSMTP_3046 [Methanosarcina sp. MTP4]
MTLIDSLLLSKKRREIVESLFYEDKTSEDLKRLLKVEWVLLKEPIKKLMEEELIICHDKKYSLSKVGRVICENTLPLVELAETFGKNPEYWISRDLSPIPEYLAGNIGKMKGCSVVVPHPDHMFEPLKEVINESEKEIAFSEEIKLCLVLFYPESIDILTEYSKRGIHITLILTKYIYDKMLNEFQDKLKLLLGSKNLNLFVFNENKVIPQIVITDFKALVIFFNQKGKYDYQELLGSDIYALEWATELFSYYEKCSEHISTI